MIVPLRHSLPKPHLTWSLANAGFIFLLPAELVEDTLPEYRATAYCACCASTSVAGNNLGNCKGSSVNGDGNEGETSEGEAGTDGFASARLFGYAF